MIKILILNSDSDSEFHFRESERESHRHDDCDGTPHAGGWPGQGSLPGPEGGD